MKEKAMIQQRLCAWCDLPATRAGLETVPHGYSIFLDACDEHRNRLQSALPIPQARKEAMSCEEAEERPRRERYSLFEHTQNSEKKRVFSSRNLEEVAICADRLDERNSCWEVRDHLRRKTWSPEAFWEHVDLLVTRR